MLDVLNSRVHGAPFGHFISCWNSFQSLLDPEKGNRDFLENIGVMVIIHKVEFVTRYLGPEQISEIYNCYKV